MIESSYNYYTEFGDSLLCLNGVTGKIFKVSKDEFNFLKRLMSDKTIQEKYPLLTFKLSQMHFLISSIDDEIEYLKSINSRVNNQEIWHLKLNPTQDCNFRCWYCYEKHVKGRMQDNIVDGIKLFVKRIFEEKKIKHFVLSWFGGEPLLYFNEIVYPISLYIQRLAQYYNVMFSNSITTNGFLLTKDVIRKCSEIGLNDFQITLDGDKKNHDKIRNQKGLSSFDRIIGNCIDLASIDSMKILLRINYDTKSILYDYSQILNCIPKNVRSNFVIQFQRIWQTYDKECNDDNVKESLKRNFMKLRNEGFAISAEVNFNIFKGIVCYSDITNYININYDGRIYRCTANDYKPENSLGFLGEDGIIRWTKKEYKDIGKRAFFDNSVCLKCSYLAICGGPCFSKWFDFKTKGLKVCPLINHHPDIDIATFIHEYYNKCLLQIKK
jgi:uncharacterized protein